MVVVASDFSYLHTQGVVYWDLKLENRGQIIDRTNNNQTCTYVPTCRHQDQQGLPRLLGALSYHSATKPQEANPCRKEAKTKEQEADAASKEGKIMSKQLQHRCSPTVVEVEQGEHSQK